MSEQSSASLASAPTALFQGYNSVLGLGLSTAVEGEFTDIGARSEVICSVCISAEDLARSLSIDQSLSVGFGPLGSFDEKLDFMTSLKVTTYSVSVTVYARHETGAKAFSHVEFKSGIHIPTDGMQANKFVQNYGDSFVSRVSYGGEYMAVYTFYSQTREEQTKLQIDLKASGIFDGVSVGGSLQTAMANFLMTTKTNYAFRQRVTGLLNPSLPMPSEFVEYAVKFPSITLDAPKVISISSAGYEIVPKAGSAFEAVCENRFYFIGDGVNSGLTSSLIAITQAQNQMNWISRVYAYYGGFEDATLTANAATAAMNISEIKDQMRAFATKATNHFFVLPLPALDNGTPELEIDRSISPHWGGKGGAQFDDVDVDTYVQKMTRLSAIGLRTGEYVDRLCATYINSDGEIATKEHGGEGGSDRGTRPIPNGEFVSKVSGRCGERLDKVLFETNKGITIGGTGGNGGKRFDWTVPSGFAVMGFRGHAGSVINGLEVHYFRLRPAKWKKIDKTGP